MLKTKDQPNLHKIHNIAAFTNKIEPFPILHLAFGLRSWRVVTGNILTNLHWTAKAYIIIVCSTFLYVSFTFIPPYFIQTQPSLIFFFASVTLYSTGSVNLSLMWLTNVNTKAVVKILKNLDILESFVPKLNGFVHGKSRVFLLIHFSSFAYVIYNANLLFKTKNLTNFKLFSNLWRFVFSLTNDLIMYQICNIVNMLSSYANIMKIALCKNFKKPEYYQKQNDPVMFFFKTKIIQYTTLNPMKKHVIEKLDLVTMEIMYDKLVETLELTNNKFNIIVSFNIHLFYFFHIMVKNF